MVKSRWAGKPQARSAGKHFIAPLSRPLRERGFFHLQLGGRGPFRGLTAAEIKMAMTTKHFELVIFSKKYSVSIEWLINGKGGLESAVAEQS